VKEVQEQEQLNGKKGELKYRELEKDKNKGRKKFKNRSDLTHKARTRD